MPTEFPQQEDPNETAPNPTQEGMDDEQGDRPVDVSWEEGRWGETEPPPPEGEGGPAARVTLA